jgi:hypothetical protein
MTPNQRRRAWRAAAPLLAAATAALHGCRQPNVAPRAAAAASEPDSAAIRADVEALASDALEGRGTGTPGGDSAAAFIARRYAALALRPLAPGYRQPFVARSAAAAHAGQRSEFPTQNVVALLPGTDPALRGQYVVVGAHYDHLGRSTQGSLDPDSAGRIHNGADDNASGTAAVLELARLFAARPAKRSVVFVAFSGEELGLLGSQHFVDHSPVPLDSVQAMMNFDMVGRLRDDKLFVYGVATARELPALVDSANQRAGLRVTAIGDGFGPSDHSSFYARDVPVLHFFTDLHDDYHRTSDDAAKLNAAGEARVVALAEWLLRDLANRPGRLAIAKLAGPAPTMGSPGTSSNVYLGSVPDMGATDVVGLRLTAVRPGSPAALGGLAGGDVIVEFDGKPVKDLYEYTDALYARQPGDTVQLVVLRDGGRRTLTVTLGKRGG